jgi:hypothetical protein
VTSLGLDRAAASQRRWCHRLTSLEAGPGGWVAIGCTVDAFGGLGRATSAELVLMLGAQVLASISLDVSRPASGAEWQWRTTRSHPVGVGTGIRSGDRGFLAVRLTMDGVVNVMPVRVPESAAPRRILRGPKVFVGVRTYPGEHGVVRWLAGRFTLKARVAGRVGRWWSALEVPVIRLLRAGARRVGERLPPSASAVFIGTGDASGSFSGQAQAISAALHERRPDIEQAWLAATSSGALTVRQAWRLARARWWVLDAPLPAAIRPPAHARMLATEVAVPIARTGVDDPDWDIASAAQRKAASALPRRWDARHAAGADTARAHLDLPADRVNVVYAPLGDECLIDLEQFVAELGDRVHLVVASGSGRPVDIPSVLRHSVRDMSAGNARELAYAASDILVTDFSPVMVDFAQAARPVVIFAPHFDMFVARTKGTYVDLEQAGPGPITRTMSELIAAMTDLLDHELRVAEPYRERSNRLGDGVPPVMSPHEFVAEMLAEA